MEQFTTKQVRNVALLAHSGAGKTSLAEAMLHATQAINRPGRVEDGNTASDFEPEEHRRRTSLQLAILPCVWKGVKVNVIDTPATQLPGRDRIRAARCRRRGDCAFRPQRRGGRRGHSVAARPRTRHPRHRLRQQDGP